MNKIKVVHILNELKFSGAEIMYVDAASIFQEKGCELTVMATALKIGEYEPFFVKAGYKVIHFPIPPLKYVFKRIKYYYLFVKLIKKRQFNLIHIHILDGMWGFALCAWLTNIRSVFTFHNVFPTHFYTYPFHCLIRWTAKYIFQCRFQTISDSVYNHEVNFYKNNTYKIYNWYGSNRYFPAKLDDKIIFRKELDIDEDMFVMISVGGCSHIKRHTDIIKGLPMIIQKIPKCLYLHLGTGLTEKEEIYLAEEIESISYFYDSSRSVQYCCCKSPPSISSPKELDPCSWPSSNSRPSWKPKACSPPTARSPSRRCPRESESSLRRKVRPCAILSTSSNAGIIR